jgi:phosphatidylserine synthase
VRWTLTTAILIFVKDHNEFQIITLLITSLVYSALLISGRPFEEPLENKMSLFTECMVSFYLYLLLCLTDFSGQADLIREPLALMLVYVIAFTVLVNLLIFARQGFMKLKKIVEKKIRVRKYIMEKEKAIAALDEAEGKKLAWMPWIIEGEA